MILQPKQNSYTTFMGWYGSCEQDCESYDLTTVRQPIRQMSKLVTQLIDEYIEDPDYESINHIVQGRLIKRKTTR